MSAILEKFWGVCQEYYKVDETRRLCRRLRLRVCKIKTVVEVLLEKKVDLAMVDMAFLWPDRKKGAPLREKEGIQS